MRRYKKFLILSFLFILPSILVYWVLAFYFFKTPLTSLVFRVYMDKKEEIAKSVSGPKIILSSGSATLYGLRAKDIQEEFGVPTVNLAVNAGLGIDYILYRAKKVMRAGDIVILPLEYNHFLYQGEYSFAKSFYIKTYDRKYFENLSMYEKIWDIVNTRPDYFFKGIIEQLTYRNAEFEVMKMDMLKNSTNNGDSFKILPKKRDLIKRIRPFDISRGKRGEKFVETAGLKTLNDFSKWCKQNNIILYITYANTIHFKEYDTASYLEYFDFLQNYFKKNGIYTIGAPSDFFYDAALFYDTEYHLTQDAITIRTKQFIGKMEELNIVGKGKPDLNQTP